MRRQPAIDRVDTTDVIDMLAIITPALALGNVVLFEHLKKSVIVFAVDSYLAPPSPCYF